MTVTDLADLFRHRREAAGLSKSEAARRNGTDRERNRNYSRAAIRDKKVVLPREEAIVREFAEHMACDAKVLDEDEETGAKRYRYIRTGADHLSLAFTYAWLAATGSVRINLADYGWIA